MQRCLMNEAITIGGTRGQMEFFISGKVLEQVTACEKQVPIIDSFIHHLIIPSHFSHAKAGPGEIYLSEFAWMLVDRGRIRGKKDLKVSFSNWKLNTIRSPAVLPSEESIPLTTQMELDLCAYLQPAVLRHIHSGSKRWLAEFRQISVIFLNLTTPFTEKQLQELQSAITKLQQIIFTYEGTVRQFMIE